MNYVEFASARIRIRAENLALIELDPHAQNGSGHEIGKY
jgi:hypothetical protein